MNVNKFNTGELVPRVSVDDEGRIVGPITFNLVYGSKEKSELRDSIRKLKDQIDRVSELFREFSVEQDLSEKSVVSYIEKLNVIRNDIGYPLFEKTDHSARLVYDFMASIISMQKDIERWVSNKLIKLNRINTYIPEQ